MIVKLIKNIPVRLKSPIFSNTISRCKYNYLDIKEEYLIGGFILPINDMNNNTQCLFNGRLLKYITKNNCIIGFDYFQGNKCWSNDELQIFKKIINDEVKRL